MLFGQLSGDTQKRLFGSYTKIYSSWSRERYSNHTNTESSNHQTCQVSRDLWICELLITYCNTAESFLPWMLRFLMPCHVLNFSSQPVDALNSWSAASVFDCMEKCFAFSWRSGPEIGVPVDLCWINQAYRALSICSSSASFRDFHFNPSLVLMLSVNFKILSLFFLMSEICCLLMPYSWAKFVPFSPLSKRELSAYLWLIKRLAFAL